MGLDKWIKPEEDEKKPKKKGGDTKQTKDKFKPKRKENNHLPKNLIKHILVCSKTNCKYQKILIKKELTNKDKICPKCRSPMKIK